MTFKEDFFRPINLVTLLLAIIGIGLAVFFYIASKQAREISYLYQNDRQLVYDSQKSGPTIRVLDKDSMLVSDNVYLQSISIWNSGDLPIDREHIRQPISVEIIGCKKILEYEITYQTHPDISHVSVVPSGTISDNPHLELNWKHLDPRMGFKLRVIFSGDPSVEVKLGGHILDVERFEEGQPHHEYSKYFLMSIIMASAMMVGTITFVKVNIGDLRESENSKLSAAGRTIIVLVAVAATLLVTLWLMYLGILPSGNQPPFS